MRGGISSYFANKILNGIFRYNLFELNEVYVGLCVTKSDGFGNTYVSEVDSDSYKRQAITCNMENFSYSTNGLISITSDIKFDVGDVGWGTITHIAVYDKQTNGEVLDYTRCVTPREATSNTSITIEKNAMHIQIS